MINQAGLFCRLRVWIFDAPVGEPGLFLCQQLVEHGDLPRIRLGSQQLLVVGDVRLEYETCYGSLPWVEPGSASTLLFQLRNSESLIFASALFAAQYLARPVDEMNSSAGKTRHGFIFVIQSGLEPVLHVLVGYRTDEDQISRPAVVLASVHVLYAPDLVKGPQFNH